MSNRNTFYILLNNTAPSVKNKDFEQLQHLTSAAGLVLLSRYFDGTGDRKAAAAPIKV